MTKPDSKISSQINEESRKNRSQPLLGFLKSTLYFLTILFLLSLAASFYFYYTRDESVRDSFFTCVKTLSNSCYASVKKCLPLTAVGGKFSVSYERMACFILSCSAILTVILRSGSEFKRGVAAGVSKVDVKWNVSMVKAEERLRAELSLLEDKIFKSFEDIQQKILRVQNAFHSTNAGPDNMGLRNHWLGEKIDSSTTVETPPVEWTNNKPADLEHHHHSTCPDSCCNLCQGLDKEGNFLIGRYWMKPCERTDRKDPCFVGLYWVKYDI